MAKHFDPRKVLRQISNSLLRQFFDRRRELLDVAWYSLSETDIQALFDAWQQLPEPQRREIQVILQDVNELADARGLGVLAEELNWRCPEMMAQFIALKSRIDKSMWVYLNAPQGFEEAARFARADRWAIGRFWYKRNSLPVGGLTVTDPMKQALSDSLVEYYTQAQGRGHWCHVEHYRRANGAEYFFAYLDDYPDEHVVFDDGGAIRKQRERAAFDNVFVYSPEDGTLELYAPGGKRVRDPLEELFCHAALGIEVDAAAPSKPAYRVNALKDPGFAFPTDPADAIAGVRVMGIRLEVLGTPGERVTLEAGPRGHSDGVHHMIQQYINTQNLPLDRVRVTWASFLLTFMANLGAKPTTLTFCVGHPNTCDLKSKPDEMRAIGERCLKLWKISNG